MFYRATVCFWSSVLRCSEPSSKRAGSSAGAGKRGKSPVSGNRARPRLLVRCETGLTGLAGLTGLFTAMWEKPLAAATPRGSKLRWFGWQFLSELKVCELGAGVLRDFSQVNMRKLQKNQLQLIEHCSCGHISTTHPARWADSQLELQTAALRSKLRCGEL